MCNVCASTDINSHSMHFGDHPPNELTPFENPRKLPGYSIEVCLPKAIISDHKVVALKRFC